LGATLLQDKALDRLRGWFLERGWTPYPFQEQAWAAYSHGESGLLYVPTGAGKTYAAYIGPLAEVAEGGRQGLQILYVTPLRAVSRDIELALRVPLEVLDADITVESRTGDTSSSVRQRQRERLPEVLITTPESLSLLLANERSAELFAGLRSIIVDEWHELLSTKRGTQLELALARLRHFAPGVRTWALSATLANLDAAARAAVGTHGTPTLLSADIERPIEVSTLLPDHVDSFPWAGHLGFSMLEKVGAWLDPDKSTLLFTNTRSQAERWYEGLRFARPEWEGLIALHHGSIDREERERVERGLKDGSVRIVVCTSSLDAWCRWAAPRASPARSSAPDAAATALARRATSSSYPRTLWSWWRWPPRARPSSAVRWSPGFPCASLWTCSPSTSSPVPWAVASPARPSAPRCARPPATRISPMWSSSGRWPWCARAAPPCAPTPSSAASWSTRAASSWRTRASPGCTSSTSAPSPRTPPSSSAIGEGAASAPWRSHTDEGPFRFAHHPEPAIGRYSWAGHLHPVVRLSWGADRLRLPCFHLGTAVGILPAFSAFTGGVDMRRRPDERIFAIADDAVVEV